MTNGPLARTLLPLSAVGALFAASTATHASPQALAVAPTSPTAAQGLSALAQMQDAFTTIAQAVEPTVVNIKAERLSLPPSEAGDTAPKAPPKGGPIPLPPSLRPIEATGSGVVVRSDGYILTNDHVVDGARNGTVTVTLSDGRQFTGKVFPDYRSDLAVVKIDPGPTPLPAATFADSSLVKPGQWAIAVGSPFDLQNTMTVGVISALNRHQVIPGEGANQERYYPDLIQTDAAINPGNSGGPLFNISGQVVGINVAIESPVEASSGVGFSIPSDMAEQIMQTLITRGKIVRGQLGVVPQDLTPAQQQLYGAKQGAWLSTVSLDSPAGKAGLQAADIVTSFDGKPITGEVDLRMAIGNTSPGSTIRVGYLREGSPQTATVTVGSAPPDPEDQSPPTAPATPAPEGLGLNVRDLTARDRVTMGLPATMQGVVVTGTDPGSPADLSGLGGPDTIGKMVIQRINRTTITSKADFDRAVAALPPGSLVTLIVVTASPSGVQQSALPLQL